MAYTIALGIGIATAAFLVSPPTCKALNEPRSCFETSTNVWLL
jgi:hypothetical protein